MSCKHAAKLMAEIESVTAKYGQASGKYVMVIVGARAALHHIKDALESTWNRGVKQGSHNETPNPAGEMVSDIVGKMGIGRIMHDTSERIFGAIVAPATVIMKETLPASMSDEQKREHIDMLIEKGLELFEQMEKAHENGEDCQEA